MKIPVWVETEVEVDITTEQIIDAINSLPEPESQQALMKALNLFANLIRKIKDEQIVKLSEGHRKLIGEFLDQQSKRYCIAAPLIPKQ